MSVFMTQTGTRASVACSPGMRSPSHGGFQALLGEARKPLEEMK